MHKTVTKDNSSSATLSPKAKAIEAIETYRLLTIGENNNNPITDEVCNLLNLRDYKGAAQAYKISTVTLLTLLAQPEVNELLKKRVGAFGINGVVDMLEKLHSFFDCLEDERITTLLEEHELKNYHYDNSRPVAQWVALEAKYNLKIDQKLLEEQGAL